MKRSRPRPKRATPRRTSALRDKPYLVWLKEQRCVVCVTLKMIYRERLCASGAGPIDPAHTENNGRGSKGPDSSCIPLCRHHHDEMDGRLSITITTKSAFASKYGLDLEKEATTHYVAFLLASGRLPKGAL